jgi:peptidase YpeB-like protein
MRKYIMPIVAVIALGLATPAMAYDSGGVLSMQEALVVAEYIGMAAVSHTQFAGDKWEIQGRDRAGRYMEVAVDASTGDVLWVNR